MNAECDVVYIMLYMYVHVHCYNWPRCLAAYRVELHVSLAQAPHTLLSELMDRALPHVQLRGTV